MVIVATEQEILQKLESKLDLYALSGYSPHELDIRTTGETEVKSIYNLGKYSITGLLRSEQFNSGDLARTSERAVVLESPETANGIKEFDIPPLKVSTKAHPVLTNKVRELLRTLWAIIVSRSIQLNFPLRSTTISVFTDPTEEESKAVLRLVCNTSISQALAFWDSLEYDFQNWLKYLSEHDRTIFITKISLRVYWQ